MNQEPGIRPERVRGGDGHRAYDKETGRLAQYELTQQAAMWGTPGANIGAESPHLRPSRIVTGRTTEYLGQQVAMWPTPNVPSGGRVVPEDARYTTTRCAYTAEGKKVQVGLEAATKRFKHSRPDPTNSTPGEKSSQSSLNSPRRLNANFVGWLMGWPTGFSDYGCSEMELSRYRLRMRSCLLRLLCGARTE
ncbi:MAG TPA: hypothetical protein VNA25_00280 [Phycisphaerae bacterium]|nr:hypothetical protein [Phycisphaerae bacterium]